jgi:16S rRNA (adenine1518-N6/adenine1519-N6)-dimethyltransferase
VSLLKQTLFNLENLKIFPAKKLGQNFLIDGNVVRKLLGVADLGNCDSVVEIGAGLGAISEKILDAGAQLFAIEVDGRLVEFLKAKFANHRNFHPLHGDGVEVPLAGMPSEVSNFKVVANLPYAISVPWMDAILGCKILPRSMHLIVQTEIGRRFFAQTKTSDFCPISIFLQSAYTLISMEKISPSSFFPEPTVSSAIVSMGKKFDNFTFRPEVKQIIGKIFTQRRKQIGGIIKNLGMNLDLWLQKSEISAKMRPEEIDPCQWRELDGFF